MKRELMCAFGLVKTVNISRPEMKDWCTGPGNLVLSTGISTCRHPTPDSEYKSHRPLGIGTFLVASLPLASEETRTYLKIADRV
jgi:hypothetical protein